MFRFHSRIYLGSEYTENCAYLLPALRRLPKQGMFLNFHSIKKQTKSDDIKNYTRVALVLIVQEKLFSV